MAGKDIKLPELSELAWGILDRLDRPNGVLDWDKVAPGARDALVAAGAAKQQTTVGASTSRKKGVVRKTLWITELGTNLLAERMAQKHRAAESS